MMRVIKLGGRIQSDPRLPHAIETLWRANSRSFCIVHGGGDEISSLQRAQGQEPAFINGRRVTTASDIEVLRMVLSGKVNKLLVSRLVAAGVPAVGISGEDGGLLVGEPIDLEQLGRAGKPTSTDARLIEALLASGFLPVISPMGRDGTSSEGTGLNINGDDAAASIAAAMQAELWLLADVAGVIGADGNVITFLAPRDLDSLVAGGTVNRGMHAKLEAGFNALELGSRLVRIAGIDAFSDSSAGTFLSQAAKAK